MEASASHRSTGRPRTLPKLFLFTLALVISNFFISQKVTAQNFNPPFPRIGQITFYPIEFPEVIWKNHDLIVIRYNYKETARRIKSFNPDVIVLATNGELVKAPGDFPDEWYLRHADGQKHDLAKRGTRLLMDLTNHCPKVNYRYGKQRFNEFLAQYLVEITDFRYFDGLFFDYWANAIWKNPHLIDLNRDGKAEGKSAVNKAWEEGNKTLIANLRKLTNKPIVAHEAGQEYLNGKGFEFWSNTNKNNPNNNLHRNRLKDLLRLRKNAVKPIINFAEGDEDHARFRAEFTSAMLGDAYYGHDEGTFAHRYTFIHDEYDANLGYPTSEPKELEPGVWVRYFDTGVIISNISNAPKTFRASQLTGGPYYRFSGNQDPQINNGQKFTSINFEVYDGIILFKEPTVLVTPIIIDNMATNLTSLRQKPAEYQGTWTQSKNPERVSQAYALGFRWGDLGYYHAYSEGGKGENTATYRPNFGLVGEYEVFEWHGKLGSPPGSVKIATNAPYTIKHATGTVTGKIDQTKNLGRWNSLGMFRFNKGNTGYVKLTNSADGYVISDAIRFVYGGEKSPGPVDRVAPLAPTGLKVTKP